jgi:hypothetical protein
MWHRLWPVIFPQSWFKYTFANERDTDLFYTLDGKSTGVRCDGGNFKTVFLPWEIEYMLESSENDTFPCADFLWLVRNILEWFGTEKERTGIEEIQTAVAPQDFILGQNYPNPFHHQTDIRYQISDGRYPIQTTLKIYNVLGQEVRTLVDDVLEPGCSTATWDGKDRFGRSVASGVYFYRLSVGTSGWTETKRMILLR